MPINPIISPFKLVIKPSTQKWLILLIPHLIGAVLLLSVAAFPFWLKAFLISLIALSFSYYLRLHLTQSTPKSVLSIQQDSAQNWFITLNSKLGETEPKSVELLPSSFISKALIVLNYRDDQRSTYGVLLTPDSNSINDFRHLTIRIKLINVKKR